MELITNKVRAKSISIAVEREDKYGKRKPSKTRNHIVPSAGMFSADEAEKIGRDMAAELGVDESRVKIDTYRKGEAPLEVNPRHRGLGHHWDRRPSEPTEVVSRKPPLVRRVFGGIFIPKTPEEVAAVEAEFEARKAAYLEQE